MRCISHLPIKNMRRIESRTLAVSCSQAHLRAGLPVGLHVDLETRRYAPEHEVLGNTQNTQKGRYAQDCQCELETTKYSKYTKKAAAPQDCQCGRKPRNTQNTQKKGLYVKGKPRKGLHWFNARTLSLVPSSNSDAREILLRSLSPEYADGTLIRSM